MGNFTFSEIFTIIVVILIVFGPNRLPEIARKAGSLAARARSAVDSLKTELNAEYGEAIAPLREARNELRAAGSEIKGQMAKFGDEVAQAGNELKGAAEEAVKPASALEDSQKSPPSAIRPRPDQALADTGDPGLESKTPPSPDEPEFPSVPQDGLELDGG